MGDATIDALLRRASYARERLADIEAGMATRHEEIERCEAKLVELEAEGDPHKDDLCAVLRAIERMAGDPREALAGMDPATARAVLKRAGLDRLTEPDDVEFPSRLALALGLGPSTTGDGS
ncbi:MAG: hypothetical protein ABL908_08590 [Hyphomicrobium sp.]